MQIRFTAAALRHGVSREDARYVIANATARDTTTKHGDAAWLYIGRDAQGRELEVIAVEIVNWHKHDPYLLVIHSMPTGDGKRR